MNVSCSAISLLEVSSPRKIGNPLSSKHSLNYFPSYGFAAAELLSLSPCYLLLVYVWKCQQVDNV